MKEIENRERDMMKEEKEEGEGIWNNWDADM